MKLVFDLGIEKKKKNCYHLSPKEKEKEILLHGYILRLIPYGLELGVTHTLSLSLLTKKINNIPS